MKPGSSMRAAPGRSSADARRTDAHQMGSGAWRRRLSTRVRRTDHMRFGVRLRAGLAALCVLPLLGAATPTSAAQGASDYEPTWQSLSQHAAPDWFNDDKFGVFIHWGPTSVPAYDEWYQYQMNRRGSGTWQHHRDTYGEGFNYDDFFPRFTAEKFDANAWVDLIEDSGAKYFALTTKHHDGYALFPSRYSDRNSVAQAPHRDLTGELFAAAKERAPELKRGAYYSIWEWLNPAETGRQPTNPYTGAPIAYTGYKPFATYPEFLNLQMKELIDNYDPDLIWCDGDWTHNAAYWNLMPTLAHYYNQAMNRQHPKDVVVNNRCRISDQGSHTDRFQPDYLTPEQVVLSDIQPFKWETSATMGTWFYLDKPGYPVPTADRLIEQLVDVVSKNGNLLLNMSPRPDGTIPADHQAKLHEIGDWLRINGEAIYGSTYWNQFEDRTANVPVRFTVKKNAVYVTAFDWPGQQLNLADTIPANPGTQVTLLGAKNSAPLAWHRENGRMIVTMPAEGAEATTSRHAYTFKISTPGMPQLRLSSDVTKQVHRGDTVPMTVTVSNTGDESNPVGEVGINAPAGLSLEPSTFKLDASPGGGAQRFRTTLSVAADAPFGQQDITMTATVGNTTFTARTRVDVQRPNLALNKPAVQSSTYPSLGGVSFSASNAVDGDTDGLHLNLSHTNNDQSAWWQVDLGSSQPVGQVAVWNRADCCTDRLANYHLVVSDSPLPNRPLTAADLTAPGVWSTMQAAPAGRPTTVPVNATGRYVRIQLAGTNYLTINEVQVFPPDD
ncbi:alpha-L-fucosidase [Micromonospora yasonensis]|uniref:alpha-L-fucosidase n=1 Tax=Micromonospora yasonensis TaxID=1128667 RepID=UPI0029F59695|nr:alpha-L-fucosidase [Micromonospora yasonensis]